MNKLDEIMDYYKLDDEIAEDIMLTEEEKSRIVEATLTKAGLNKKNEEQAVTSRKRIHGKRFSVLLAACIAVFAMGAVSFAAVSMNGGIVNFFNPQNQEETDLLNSLGVIIDKQVTAKGMTIDIKEAVGDSNAVYVVFDIIAPAGLVLDKEQYTFIGNYVDIKDTFGGRGMGYHFETLKDDDIADNRISMMLCLSSSKNLAGKNMTLRFLDFSTYKTSEEMDNMPEKTQGDEKDFYNIIVPGEWEITFPLNYKDNSSVYKVNEKVIYENKELYVKKVSLSPISIKINIEGNEEKNLIDTPLFIHLKNGETVDLSKCSRGAYSGSLEDTILDAQFDRIIKPEDVKSIEFCGQTLPIQF